jgi:hypothetical protein
MDDPGVMEIPGDADLDAVRDDDDVRFSPFFRLN